MVHARTQVVIVQRGDCYFFNKASYAAQAGALAVLVVNNVDEDTTPGVVDPASGKATVKIPVSIIGRVSLSVRCAIGTYTIGIGNRYNRYNRYR